MIAVKSENKSAIRSEAHFRKTMLSDIKPCLSWQGATNSPFSTQKILHSVRRSIERRSNGPQSLQVQNQIVRRQTL